MPLGKDAHRVEEQACETQLGGSGSRKNQVHGGCFIKKGTQCFQTVKTYEQ